MPDVNLFSRQSIYSVLELFLSSLSFHSNIYPYRIMPNIILIMSNIVTPTSKVSLVFNIPNIV